MRKTIPYGQANYEEIVENNNYFVDKTHYIAALESVNNPIFLILTLILARHGSQP